MKNRYINNYLLCVFLLILLSDSIALGWPPTIYNLGPNIPDLAVHHLYTNGLDLGAAGIEAFIEPVYPDSADGVNIWNVVVTNTGSVAWDDFHLWIKAKVPLAALGIGFTSIVWPPPQAVSGFGAPPAIIFFNVSGLVKAGEDLYKEADLPASKTSQVVPPGGTLGLSITVGCVDVTPIGGNYHIGLQATPVPEPATALLLAFGGLALLRRRKA